jgi:hypothetical protein
LLREGTAPGSYAQTVGLRDETESELRARLGGDAYAAAYSEGRALELEVALMLALGE